MEDSTGEPLHKEGVRNDINNYRLISILPTLSKTLEKKHVANSLHKFLRDNNLIYNLQSAFRTAQLAQSRCSNVVSTFAERLNNVAIDVASTFFCELVGTW